MQICNCNELTKDQILEAKKAGASAPGAVYDHLRVAPKCGRCFFPIKALLKDDGAKVSAPPVIVEGF